ncbi:hypothetical protein PTTG_07900 [Puccinia triticina 1-1 BBBD Race 1]|uniref:Uncharacterized protein n=1 Tax=Puccinia triticina (isolate 1-1 / race 1 (BBBD)) TaxID=630390 RepID=A0A0C4F466_PUCT1|nr:hypothetical protein PTTG_07900 [Puccinia triticina 1-1 BBBD Race 1]
MKAYSPAISFPSPPLQSSSSVEDGRRLKASELFDEADVPAQLRRRKGQAGVRSERSSSRTSGQIRPSVSEPVASLPPPLFLLPLRRNLSWCNGVVLELEQISRANIDRKTPLGPATARLLLPRHSRDLKRVRPLAYGRTPSAPIIRKTRRTIQEPSTGVGLKAQIATSEASAPPKAAREEASFTMTALTTAGLDPPCPRRSRPPPDYSPHIVITTPTTGPPEPLASSQLSFIITASDVQPSTAAAADGGAPAWEQLWMRESDGGFVKIDKY